MIWKGLFSQTNNAAAPRKILILGTSNSIIRNGWVDGFRKGLPTADITNLSVGASPGVQFATALGLPLHQYDMVIFDSVVNDEVMGHLVGTAAFSRRLMFEILSSIAAHTRLVVLGFTSQTFFRNASGTYLERCAMSSTLGADFVGLREIILNHEPEIVSRHGALYRDVAHVAETIAFDFGLALAQALCRHKPARRRRTKDFQHLYKVVRPEDFAQDQPLIARKNSVVSARFRHIKPGYRLQLEPESLFLGFYFNALQTSCTLRLTLANGEIKDFLMSYMIKNDALQKKYVPLPDGIQAQSLEVVAKHSHDRLAYSTPQLPSGGEIKLELADLLYRTPDVPPMPNPVYAAPNDALHHLVHETFGRDLRKSLLESIT